MDDWIGIVKTYLTQIETLKPKDRLETCGEIGRCVDAIRGSVAGWINWLSNPGLMSNFTEDELAEVFKRMRQVAVDFLNLDLDATLLAVKKRKDIREPPPQRQVV